MWTIKPNGNGTFTITLSKKNYSKQEISKIIVALRQVICGELDDGNEGIIDFPVLSQIAIPSLDMR